YRSSSWARAPSASGCSRAARWPRSRRKRAGYARPSTYQARARNRKEPEGSPSRRRTSSRRASSGGGASEAAYAPAGPTPPRNGFQKSSKSEYVTSTTSSSVATSRSAASSQRRASSAGVEYGRVLASSGAYSSSARAASQN